MIAYFDMFSGISGDMTLGAFVDLGVPVDWLIRQIRSLPLTGFDIREESVWRNGIKAVNLFVDADPHAPARDYASIRKLLSESGLSHRVKTLSLKAFEAIARAESKIHGSPLEKVHFHEVGGIDAVVDIVGTFLCVEYLDIQKVYASKVPLGSGTVRCSHGLLPVPVPATLEILNGVPVVDSGIGFEIVTPTGAAIITTLADTFGSRPDMVMGNIGYGSGKRTAGEGLPNLLRIVLGEEAGGTGGAARETIMVVETTIDDMNPEIFGYLMEKLFEAGALDVCHIPVQMKKNRPGTRIEILCKEDVLETVMDLVFTQSTTTGIRYHRANRAVIHREAVTVETRFGSVGAKSITGIHGETRLIPEFENCRKIAEARGIPLRDVYEQLYLDMAESRI